MEARIIRSAATTTTRSKTVGNWPDMARASGLVFCHFVMEGESREPSDTPDGSPERALVGAEGNVAGDAVWQQRAHIPEQRIRRIGRRNPTGFPGRFRRSDGQERGERECDGESHPSHK